MRRHWGGLWRMKWNIIGYWSSTLCICANNNTVQKHTVMHERKQKKHLLTYSWQHEFCILIHSNLVIYRVSHIKGATEIPQFGWPGSYVIQIRLSPHETTVLTATGCRANISLMMCWIYYIHRHNNVRWTAGSFIILYLIILCLIISSVV